MISNFISSSPRAAECAERDIAGWAALRAGARSGVGRRLGKHHGLASRDRASPDHRVLDALHKAQRLLQGRQGITQARTQVLGSGGGGGAKGQSPLPKHKIKIQEDNKKEKIERRNRREFLKP